MIQCKKQTTVAIIMKDGFMISMGINAINNPKVHACPRVEQGMKTGEGYHLCKEVCNQNAHAEVDAINNATEPLEGAELILIGHTYCCANCLEAMKKAGIKTVKIADTGKIYDI